MKKIKIIVLENTTFLLGVKKKIAQGRLEGFISNVSTNIAVRSPGPTFAQVLCLAQNLYHTIL